MKRSFVFAVAIVLAAAACSGDDTADPTTTPTASSTSTATAVSSSTIGPTTAVPTSTTAPPTTTEPNTGTTAPNTSQVLPSAPPTSYPFPLTDAGQPDWVPIVQELLETGTGLSLEPNLDRVTEYCMANSVCYDDWQAYVGNLIADDAHAEGLVTDRVISVEVSTAQGDRDPIATGAVVLSAQVEVVGNEEGARVADSNGNTLYVIERDAQPGDVVTMSFFLGLDTFYEWRVVQESSSESS